MIKILVTGSSGFIGSALTTYLTNSQLEVYEFDMRDVSHSPRHRQGSILRPDEINLAVEGMDVVFHLGGLVGTSELLSRNVDAIDSNIKGTVNVLEACYRQGVKTMFYPGIPDVWINTYSITKKAAQDFARMYAKLYGLDVRILRWLNAYGPGQKLYPVRKAVPMMILQGLHNLDIEIWGDGEQSLFLIYVEDLVRDTARYTLYANRDSIIRDTGNTVRITVNELAELILNLTNSSAGIKHLPMRLGEDPTNPVTLLPIPTAADILGVSELTTPLVDGLSATVNYIASLTSEQRESALAFHYHLTAEVD